MKILFHDLQSQYRDYKTEINAAISQVLEGGQFILGKEVYDFEHELAAYLNCKHVITCANGTDALLLALMAIDLKPGEEVITTPFTFIATAEVIALLGAKPVFVDIEPDTYHLDHTKIKEKISEKTRAILPVSLYGQPVDIDPINELANDYGIKLDKKIYVIEDAAQSLGAEYKSRKSANLSDIGCVSFFPTKPLGCYGDGGAIIVNNDLLAEKIKSLRVHGQTRRYHHKYIGINGRLDTLQAAILQVKLKYFSMEIERRNKIAERYQQLLSRPELILPNIKPDRTSVYAQYSIRVKERSKFIEYLHNKHIPTAIHYPLPIHLQECFSYLGYQPGDFPVAEMVANEIVSLPMSAFITEFQQQYIANAIAEIFHCESQTG